MKSDKILEETDKDCVVCDGTYSTWLLSGSCYDVHVCKKHILEISKILLERLKKIKELEDEN